MKKIICILFAAMSLMPAAAKKQPAVVILTAGQSNTDGRVDNTDLPAEIQKQKYKYCQWSFGSSSLSGEGKFETFWPRINNKNKSGRWAYDAIVYWNVEKKLKNNFYVIKESLGGTAIDTLCRSTSKQYWNASPEYLAKNVASDKGGKSLLKAFTENIGACIDNQLSHLPEGYDIKFMLWHQGESDRHQAKNYYKNLKQMITYIRTYLVDKTGNKKYANLPIIIGGIIGRYVFHINYYTLLGVLAGANTNPSALAYVREQTSADAPTVGYANVYPFAMFLRIVTIQIIIFVFG